VRRLIIALAALTVVIAGVLAAYVVHRLHQ